MRVPSQPDWFVVKDREDVLDALAAMRAEDMVVCDTTIQNDAEGIEVARLLGDGSALLLQVHGAVITGNSGELVRPIPVQRYDDEGRPVVTNEKAADLAIVRLQDPS